MDKSRLDQGFTLLEIVLVLFIIGLVVAVSVPSLRRGTATFQLQATGRDVLGTMRYAREKAVTEQKEMRLTIDRESQKIVLSDASGGGERAFVMPAEVRILRMALGGQEVQEGPMVIRYLPNGSSESGELLLVSSKGHVVKIASDPITGGARLQVLPGESQP